jgi:transcription initiation factor TFIIA large subunit
MKVAQMPWDPAPISIATGGIGPSSAGGQDGVKAEQYVKTEPHIKQEVKYENDALLRYSGHLGTGLNPHATERMAQNLQQRFGAQANASIQAAGLPQAQPRVYTLPGQVPGQMPGVPPMQSQTGLPRVQGHLPNAQLDGGLSLDAWDEIKEGVRRDGTYKLALDRILERTAVDTLGEASSSSLPAIPSHVPEITFTSLAPISLPHHLRKPNALDGDGDHEDEVPDEDAINSDLDDDDDDDNQNINDDGHQGDTILCLWDKVNRVKNKVRLPNT